MRAIVGILLPRLPVGIVALLALAPYLIHHEAEFRADDWLLLANVAQDGGILESLWNHLVHPYCNTWTAQLYMPLFSWFTSLELRIFGSDPSLFLAVNIFLHVLASCLGYLVFRRILGTRSALLASVLFAANPWAMNNVLWTVGSCSTVSSLCIWWGALLWWKWSDRGGSSLPWAAFAVCLFGTFFRQTTMFLPVFCVLIDWHGGRATRGRIGAWTLMFVPVMIYFAASTAILGSFGPTYERMGALIGEGPDRGTLGFLLDIREVTYDLFVPGRGDDQVDFGTLRLSGFAAAVGILLLGWRSWRPLKGDAALFAAFGILYSLPLFVSVDRIVRGDTSQRWYPVMWAVAGLYAACAKKSRIPLLSTTLLLYLAVFGFIRLHENLEQYDDSTRLTRNIRSAISNAEHETVFVYNLKRSYGAANFFPVGLGQTQLPPFSDNSKIAYPVSAELRWGPDPKQQAPLAAILNSRGVPCSAVFADYERQRCFELPDSSLRTFATEFLQLPKLPLIQPTATVLRNVEKLKVTLDATDMDHVEIHLFTTVAHIRVVRIRGRQYRYGGFQDDGTYEEELRPFLEYATLLDGRARGRCWLWVVGWQRGTGEVRVSDFHELHSTVPQGKPE